jgi:hypothetical protein
LSTKEIKINLLVVVGVVVVLVVEGAEKIDE